MQYFGVGNTECFLQNIHAPLRNFSLNFNEVFAQVIKLGHFYVAINQSIIKLFTLCIFAASSGKNTNRKKRDSLEKIAAICTVFSVFSVRFRWFNFYKLWLDYSSSLGIIFATFHPLFRHFFPNFCKDFSPRSVHFFPTFCYNIALIAQHYCVYFSPVFAHLHLNFCSNWCLVVASVCLLMTPSFQTSTTIVEVSCESYKSLLFSTTQLDVG